MPNLDEYLGAGGKSVLSKTYRDEITETMLAMDGVSVQFLRGAALLTAQTVIIAHQDDSRKEKTGDAGRTGEAQTFVIGLPTLDVKRGDRFTYQGTQYDIIMVWTSIPGRIKAACEARR